MIRMTVNLNMLCLLAVLAVGGRADPPTHAEWELTFQDEFDADSLDWTVWQSQSSARGGEKPEGRWPENNVLVNGILRQVTKREAPPRGGKGWSAAHIWTREFAQQYGYFEARMRYGKYLNNAFWLWRPRGRFADPPHFEIDINEGHTPREVAMTFHYYTYDDDPRGELWSTGRRWDAPVDLDEDFHVYGVEWDEKLITWYFDGAPVRVLENPNARAPADVRLSTVIMERALERDGVPVGNMDGVAMEVDWVRVYRKTTDLSVPTLPPAERHELPRVVESQPRVRPGRPGAGILAEDFERAEAGRLPSGWQVGDRSPSVAQSPTREGEKALRLAAGDYAFRMFEEGIDGQVAVELDCYHPSRDTGLLVVTLGRFDQQDPERRRTSYYTGDIGPYIHWHQRGFLSYYTETDKWTHIARWSAGEWVKHRLLLNTKAGVFDCYDAGTGAFEGSGVFRHRQRAACGIGLRHRGRGAPVYVDTVKVTAFVPDRGGRGQ